MVVLQAIFPCCLATDDSACGMISGSNLIYFPRFKTFQQFPISLNLVLVPFSKVSYKKERSVFFQADKQVSLPSPLD